MRIEKKTLLAALRAAARMAGSRTASHWLRTCRLRALGMGDEVEFCAWGPGASIATRMDGDALPGETLAALSDDLLPLAEAARGEQIKLWFAADRLRVDSDGRVGMCEFVVDSHVYAPPVAAAPAQLASTATMPPSVAAGFARALRLAAACVDRDGTPDAARHVAVHSDLALTVLATDGANCVHWRAPIAAHGHEPATLTPGGARLLADAVNPEGEARELRLEVAEGGIRAKVGPVVLNLGRRTDARVLSLSAVDRYLAAREDSRRVEVDPKELLSASRYAAHFSTSETTATVLEWSKAGGCVRSWDARGSTTIAMRSKKDGRAIFGAERLARALSGLDGEERGAASILLDEGPEEPLQVFVKGDGWERRHIVAAMNPEGMES